MAKLKLFTDEMHKAIFPFPDSNNYRTSTGKPIKVAQVHFPVTKTPGIKYIIRRNT